MFYRTHNCNELREGDAGKKVKICGWLDSKRDKGGLLFAVAIFTAPRRWSQRRSPA